MLESLLNKYAGLKACNFIKKRLQHIHFPEKFAKFLRTYFFIEHILWLILEISRSLLYLRKMNAVFSWYTLALQRFFPFTACVSFHSISFFFFLTFLWISPLFGFEVSLPMLEIKQWSSER